MPLEPRHWGKINTQEECVLAEGVHGSKWGRQLTQLACLGVGDALLRLNRSDSRCDGHEEVEGGGRLEGGCCEAVNG